MFYAYVLHSLEDHGLFIGFSANLRSRIAEHNHGAFATKHRGPWKLIYYEAYLDRQDAEGRERYLKSGSGRRSLSGRDSWTLSGRALMVRGVS